MLSARATYLLHRSRAICARIPPKQPEEMLPEMMTKAENNKSMSCQHEKGNYLEDEA